MSLFSLWIKPISKHKSHPVTRRVQNGWGVTNGPVSSSSLRTSLSFLLKMCMNKLHLLGYRKGRLFLAISWQIACDLNHISIQWLFNSKNCFLSPLSLWRDFLGWEKNVFPLVLILCFCLFFSFFMFIIIFPMLCPIFLNFLFSIGV